MEQTTIYELKLAIQDTIKKTIKELFNGYGIEKMYDCTVVSADETQDPYTQNVAVTIAGDTSIIDGLRNLSGEILSIGDHVRVYAARGNISNGYIGVKCGMEGNDE